MRAGLTTVIEPDVEVASVAANFDQEFRRLESRIDKRLRRTARLERVRALMAGSPFAVTDVIAGQD